jgi:outer membrane receptor for ferrienterochelin and colicin
MIFFVELMSNRSSSSAGVPAWSVLTLLALPAAVHAQVTSSPTLPSVFVTATRYEQESISTPAYLTVITRDQIEKASVSTVNEAVSRLGGLATRTSLNGGNELTIDPMGFGDTAGSNLRNTDRKRRPHRNSEKFGWRALRWRIDRWGLEHHHQNLLSQAT